MDDATQLIDSLRRQREKYAEVAVISERQRSLLESSDLDALLQLVERKRAVMEEIDAIKRNHAGPAERWPERRGRLPVEQVHAVEVLIEETRSLLERILKIEEEDRARFERGRDVRADELCKLQQQKRLRDAYGKKEEGNTRFFDDTK